MGQFRVDRRSLLVGGGLLGAGLLGLPAQAVTEAELFPVAETKHGKVKGITWSGVHAFKGVPYGASTGGKNRWMPPVAPAAWKGEREAFDYGPISPQVTTDRRSDYSSLIMWDLNAGAMGEDMLTLNVWTKGLKDGAKRPVLVSFHGGGYTTGSGNAPGFDGDPMVRFADVVVVTVNHRLGALGYINLVDVGASKAYANSGSVGLMDLVASLQWVHDNIANFGGDPGRVFIFGQSGGGAKTSSVYSMPSAKGLFHRAAIQSGSAIRGATRQTSAETTRKLMDKLGIAKNAPEKLVQVPWTQILAAQQSIQGGFSPIVSEGTAFARDPFYPDAPPASKDVPVIISYAKDDAALRLTNFDVDKAGVIAGLTGYSKEKAERIYAAYRAEYPNVSPFLINARIRTDMGARSSQTQLDLKYKQGGAKAWHYIWEWETKGMDGKFGAVHGADVAMSFHNPRGPLEGGASSEARRMADLMASAWASFAASGDPNANNKVTPNWPAWDPEKKTTMLFDINCRAVQHPHKGLWEMWADVGAPERTASAGGNAG
jgi:para-nitrobenzyl esterase